MERFGFQSLPDAELTVRARINPNLTTEVVFTSRGIRRGLGIGSDAHIQLHWACARPDGSWVAPTVQPQGSRAVDAVASRLSLDASGGGQMGFVQADNTPEKITFVVLVESAGQQHWLKCSSGGDFLVDVAQLAKAAELPVSMAVPGVGLRVAERPSDWPALDAAKRKVEVAEAASGAAKERKSQRRGPRNSASPCSVQQSEREVSVEQGRGSLAWHVVRMDNTITVFIEAKLLLPEGAMVQLHWGGQASPGGEWTLPDIVVPGAQSVGDGKASRTLLENQARAELCFQPADVSPGGIAFVLFISHMAGSELWLKEDSGKDFAIPVLGYSSPGKVAGVSNNFCDAETKYSNWSHFQRICMANEVLGQTLGPSEAAWLACDLRLAHAKMLEWYRNRGYQPKDMAYAQESLGKNLANVLYQTKHPLVRTLLRLCTPAVTIGNSGGGDAIRHGILNIMRTHGIKEGHRPGIQCRFIEQWHQKLHTNSAPDDIVICEGYLAFLSSGNPDDMWRTIWDVGRISRDDLSKMCTCGFQDHTKSGAKGLNVTPLHLPQLTNDMKGYLGLLKHVHGGTDLLSLCEKCKGQFPDHGTECIAFEVFHRREDPATISKIAELRRRLAPCLGKRDVLLLDAAMEGQLRVLAEQTDVRGLCRDSLLVYVNTLLLDLQLSRQDASLDYGIALWHRLIAGDGGGVERWSPEWCKMLHAACDRLVLVGAHTADAVATLLQECADKLLAAGRCPGTVFQPAEKHLASFGEETARCLTERLAAQAFRQLMPMLRRAAGLGAWEIVSSGRGGKAFGVVVAMHTLPTTPMNQGPQIVVLETMTGWEDIPFGIAAILLPFTASVDTLSHVAIRARNQHVLLASCDDETQLAELKGLTGTSLQLEVFSGGVTWSSSEVTQETAAACSANTVVQVVKPPPPPCQVLGSALFEQHRRCLGGKSLHLAELQSKSGEYKVPASVTVPFGICEEVLAAEINDGVLEELQEVVATGSWAVARQFLIEEVEVPQALELALQEELKAAGAPLLPSEVGWKTALKSVWASKWSDRAVSSRRQTGIPDEALFLAVLVQPLMDSKYAFVIHTHSPLPGAEKGDQLIELCIGLGESLVSNSPGRALSATVGDGQKIIVHSYPSKPDGVFAPEGGCHIFRSDSNGEDLEGFAGAGLYDSVTSKDCQHGSVSYADESLFFDQVFRRNLLLSIFELGRRVEGRFNGMPQDIEGAVLHDGSLIVTQSRPQV